jgi:putative transposase
MNSHKHSKHLEQIWLQPAVFFITICSSRRQSILACEEVVEILVKEWTDAGERHGWTTGRYVVMPDHVHFFCAPVGNVDETGNDLQKEYSLSRFLQQWKQWTSKQIIQQCGYAAPVWQAGYFDHLLRSAESYQQKWEYVRENPVRAGLVKNVNEWLWQGEIHDFM